MDIKSFLNHTKIGFILKNLIAAIVVAVVLFFIVLGWLRRYTEHGIEIDVPDVTGMYVEEARVKMEHEGLHLTVIDSTYSRKVPLGTVVEQNPVADSRSKHGRTIYVIINANSVRQVPMPDLHDISFRQAEATLRSLNINVTDYVYEPSEYKDLVLDVRQYGKTVPTGSRVNEGSNVTLVVGRGRGNAQIVVPNLCGKKLPEARSLLLANLLTLGIYEYDIKPTKETKDLYIVYKQDPAAGTTIQEGTRVDLYLSTDIEKAIISNDNTDDNNDDNFF